MIQFEAIVTHIPWPWPVEVDATTDKCQKISNFRIVFRFSFVAFAATHSEMHQTMVMNFLELKLIKVQLLLLQRTSYSPHIFRCFRPPSISSSAPVHLSCQYILENHYTRWTHKCWFFLFENMYRNHFDALLSKVNRIFRITGKWSISFAICDCQSECNAKWLTEFINAKPYANYQRQR